MRYFKSLTISPYYWFRHTPRRYTRPNTPARTSSEDSETNQRHLIRVHLRADAATQALHRPPRVAADWDRVNNTGEAWQWPEEAWSSVDPYMGLKEAKEAEEQGAEEKKTEA